MANEWPQLLVDHASTAGPAVTHVRGSLVVSSLQTLRELDFYPRYIAKLPAACHEPVLFALASSWLPIEVAMAHYGACEAMALSSAEMEAVGAHVSERIMGSFMATLVRRSGVGSAVSGSVLALQNYHRLWDRLLQGGACKVTQTAPKDALIESGGVPMFRYAYFSGAYAALIRAAGMIPARSCYVRILRRSNSAMSISISWA